MSKETVQPALLKEGLAGTMLDEGLAGTMLDEGLAGTLLDEGLAGTLLDEGRIRVVYFRWEGKQQEDFWLPTWSLKTFSTDEMDA